MKATYQQLLNVATIYKGENVIGRFQALPLKISTGSILRRILRHADAAIEDYNADRNALIKKYGEEQADGNFVVKEAGTNIPFQMEMAELLAVEVDLPGERFAWPAGVLTQKEIEKDDIGFARSDLDMLSWLLDEGEIEEEPVEETAVEESAPMGETKSEKTSDTAATESDNILELGDAKAAKA